MNTGSSTIRSTSTNTVGSSTSRSANSEPNVGSSTIRSPQITIVEARTLPVVSNITSTVSTVRNATRTFGSMVVVTYLATSVRSNNRTLYGISSGSANDSAVRVQARTLAVVSSINSTQTTIRTVYLPIQSVNVRVTSQSNSLRIQNRNLNVKSIITCVYQKVVLVNTHTPAERTIYVYEVSREFDVQHNNRNFEVELDSRLFKVEL